MNTHAKTCLSICIRTHKQRDTFLRTESQNAFFLNLKHINYNLTLELLCFSTMFDIYGKERGTGATLWIFCISNFLILDKRLEINHTNTHKVDIRRIYCVIEERTHKESNKFHSPIVQKVREKAHWCIDRRTYEHFMFSFIISLYTIKICALLSVCNITISICGSNQLVIILTRDLFRNAAQWVINSCGRSPIVIILTRDLFVIIQPSK